MFPVLFKCNYIDEEQTIEKKEFGMICAGTYPEAAEKLLQYYGEDQVTGMSLTMLSDDPVVLTEDVCNKILKGDYTK